MFWCTSSIPTATVVGLNMFDPSSLEIHMMLNSDLEDEILDSSAILSSADGLAVYFV